MGTFSTHAIHFDKKPIIGFRAIKGARSTALMLSWDETQLNLFFRDSPTSIETIEELQECLERLKNNLKVELVIP